MMIKTEVMLRNTTPCHVPTNGKHRRKLVNADWKITGTPLTQWTWTNHETAAFSAIIMLAHFHGAILFGTGINDDISRMSRGISYNKNLQWEREIMVRPRCGPAQFSRSCMCE